MSYLLALLGSVISIAALWVEYDSRRQERICVDAIARYVAWRADESLGNNLKQFILLLGAALLCTFYTIEGAPLYVEDNGAGQLIGAYR